MILQSLRMALRAIAANKLRSFLTMLGIIIGVLAVVVLISLVNGATNSVTAQIEGLGSNLLTVSVRSGRYQPLSMREVLALRDQPGIYAAAPSITQPLSAKAGNKTFDATVEGTTAGYDRIRNLSLARGRFIKTPDVDNNTPVAVIGAQVAQELFGNGNAVGQTLSLGGREFLVIGTLEDDGETMIGGGADSKIIIPYTLAQRMFAQGGVNLFYVSSEGADAVEQAQASLERALLERFRQDEDAFTVISQSTILAAMNEITGTMTLLLGGIAGISLLVGGIGIMNIMLVSVAERTREIGIRKAVGATRLHVLAQFLIEALTLSLIGSLIGLTASGGLLALISSLFDMSFGLSGDVVLLAIGFSIFIGVVFGIYPANKASKMHPIQALRYE